MMQNFWLKKQKLNYSKNVIDIVQFGSSVMKESNPNDADIAVIFHNIPLKKQLDEAQEIKKQLQKKSELPIHIKAFDIHSLFDASNFARENIFFYGKSLLSKDSFSKKFGLSPRLQILYSLKDMEKKDKIRFNYSLSGKGGKYGLLKRYGGELICPGLIEVDPLYENIFVDSIKKLTPRFKLKKAFFQL